MHSHLKLPLRVVAATLLISCLPALGSTGQNFLTTTDWNGVRALKYRQQVLVELRDGRVLKGALLDVSGGNLQVDPSGFYFHRQPVISATRENVTRIFELRAHPGKMAARMFIYSFLGEFLGASVSRRYPGDASALGSWLGLGVGIFNWVLNGRSKQLVYEAPAAQCCPDRGRFRPLPPQTVKPSASPSFSSPPNASARPLDAHASS